MKTTWVSYTAFIILCCVGASCKKSSPAIDSALVAPKLELTLQQAELIFDLPKHCILVEYPNKMGQVLGSETDLKGPKALRPIFYGCFDWHSSVHGFWSLVKLMKIYPELDENGELRKQLNTLLTADNAAVELAFFNDANNANFERTYGWAWLFQLQTELKSWKDADAQRWAQALQPLVDLLVVRYQDYLPKLNYPIRTGTHDNSAFSLSMALDYARASANSSFENAIVQHSERLFATDKNCNLAFEPSGHDFLSPCLEEARLMSKIYGESDYKVWLSNFLPQIFAQDFELAVGRVSDRTDGHLVHLDGLNFSRATCLKAMAKKLPELKDLDKLAQEHFDASFGNITNDDYMGSHWLGSFALYALSH